MSITNPPKAFIALTALVCLTVLMAVGRIEQSAGVGMLGLIVGYAIGNGIAASKNDPVQPIIGPKQQPTVADQVATLVKAELEARNVGTDRRMTSRRRRANRSRRTMSAKKSNPRPTKATAKKATAPKAQQTPAPAGSDRSRRFLQAQLDKNAGK